MKKNVNNIPFKIALKGSLGILAYGDIALREWRKVKKASIKKPTSNNEE